MSSLMAVGRNYCLGLGDSMIFSMVTLGGTSRAKPGMVTLGGTCAKQLRKKLTFRRLPVSDLTAYVLQLGQHEIGSHVSAEAAT